MLSPDTTHDARWRRTALAVEAGRNVTAVPLQLLQHASLFQHYLEGVQHVLYSHFRKRWEGQMRMHTAKQCQELTRQITYIIEQGLGDCLRNEGQLIPKCQRC